MNEKQIWTFLKSKGFTDAGCAGIMGNLYAESGLNPQNMQNSYEAKLGMNDTTYTNGVDNGTYTNFVKDSVGYGLAQWTYWSRKQNLLNFSKQQGSSIGSLTMQLDFLYVELTTSFPSLVKLLKSTNDVAEASNGMLLQFERPADQGEARQKQRAAYSQKYYDQFHITAIVSSSVTGGNNMKYNEKNKPLVCMQTTSRCYLNTTKMVVKGVLIHSTGANNPYISRYIQPADNAPDKQEMLKLLGVNKYSNDYNHNPRATSGLNAFIGKLTDGTVTSVQSMPWDFAPWGCYKGKNGSCNNNWIQFEICEDGLNDPVYFNKIYQETIELVAYLCKLYNLDPHGTVIYNGVKVPVILCHQDSYQLGLGSNHGDVLHWFPKYGKSMETVRNDVAAKLAGTSTSIEEDEDMTDERFAKLMNNWLVKKANEKETWGTENLEWVKNNGIMVGGTGGAMMPNKFCTRLEVATMLKRLAEKLGMK